MLDEVNEVVTAYGSQKSEEIWWMATLLVCKMFDDTRGKYYKLAHDKQRLLLLDYVTRLLDQYDIKYDTQTIRLLQDAMQEVLEVHIQKFDEKYYEDELFEDASELARQDMDRLFEQGIMPVYDIIQNYVDYVSLLPLFINRETLEAIHRIGVHGFLVDMVTQHLITAGLLDWFGRNVFRSAIVETITMMLEMDEEEYNTLVDEAQDTLFETLEDVAIDESPDDYEVVLSA